MTMQDAALQVRDAEAVSLVPYVDNFAMSPDLVTLAWDTSGEAESFRALRTHVVARHIQDGRRALATCAVTPGVGCTFVAANLAVALSQIGIKTLLIDANMRNPSVDQLFQAPQRPMGLQQCLTAADAAYADFIHEDVIPNLSIMFAGGTPHNPQELLAMGRFADLMSDCLRHYEMTIVDTPPASSCSDANRVSSVVGYSLVVVRRDQTLFSDVKTLINQLESDRAQVVGTVLTEI